MNATLKTEVRVRLGEAGSVTLVVDIDLAKISLDDHDFVFSLFKIMLERARQEALAKGDTIGAAMIDADAQALVSDGTSE